MSGTLYTKLLLLLLLQQKKTPHNYLQKYSNPQFSSNSDVLSSNSSFLFSCIFLVVVVVFICRSYALLQCCAQAIYSHPLTAISQTHKKLLHTRAYTHAHTYLDLCLWQKSTKTLNQIIILKNTHSKMLSNQSPSVWQFNKKNSFNFQVFL